MAIAQGFHAQTTKLAGFKLIRHALANSTRRPPFSVRFIPGNALHSCENTGTSDLRIAYVFAVDSFEEVEFVFEE